MSIVNSYIYNTSWLYVCQVVLEFLIAVVCICVVNSPADIMLIFKPNQLWAILPVALVAALGYSMEPLAGLCGRRKFHEENDQNRSILNFNIILRGRNLINFFFNRFSIGATIYAVLNQFKLGITAALMLAILQVGIKIYKM